MRDSVKFDPSIPDRQVTGESSASQHTCSSASQSEYLDVQSFSSASSYMALPSLKHGKRHIPLSSLGPPGTASRRTGCSNDNCRCEEESIMQNMCNKRSERLNKPCKNGFCYCFTSDSEDFRRGPSTSAEHHRCKALRKEYAYNLPTESDCSEVVSSDQYFADKEKEKKKKRISLPPDVLDSVTVHQNGTAGCSHKDGKCSKDKCRRRPFQATNKFKEFHCSDSDAPLIHIIQEVQRNTVVSEIRINRSKLKKSKVRSKSAGRAGEEGGSAKVATSDKIINTEYLGSNGHTVADKSSYRPEGKDAGTNTLFSDDALLQAVHAKKSTKKFSPSEDDDSRSDLSNAKTKSNKSKGGRLLLKRIGPEVTYRPSLGPPRKPPRNFSSSSDCSSLASEPMKTSKYAKKKNRMADNSIASIGDQPTMPADFPLVQDTDESSNGRGNFKKGSINSLNSIVNKKPEVTKDTFEKLSAKVESVGDRTSICSSEGGYSKPVVETLNIQNDSFGSGPSSRQEFTPTCPPYSEVASPEASNINDLLRMLPNVPSGPVIFDEPLNKLNIVHVPHPVDFAEINVIPPGEIPNPEQVGWVPPAVYNMLNNGTATQKFESQNPMAGPQQVPWQPPPKLQIDTVDGTQQTSENENSHNLASNMELKSTPVKPDIPKEELTPKNVLREKMKNLPQPPSKPVRQVAAEKMPTLLEMSHSGDEKTILTFAEILASANESSDKTTGVANVPKNAPVSKAPVSISTESSTKTGPTVVPSNPVKKTKEASSKDISTAEKVTSILPKDSSTLPKDSSKMPKHSSTMAQTSSTMTKDSSVGTKDVPAKDPSATSKDVDVASKDSAVTPKVPTKSFQKRALKHTKSFLESLGFSKKKDARKGANKEPEEPPKMVETVGTQTNDGAVLQGRRLKFDYASDDTLERRSITPIGREDDTSVAKPTHHSDDGFDFSRKVQSPKPERTSQRKNFTPKAFLKTLQPGEKAGHDESYRSYASDLSEDFTVAVQDLLGKAKAKLEGESFTTAPETVTNTLTDESVAACTISALADVHPEPIYAEIVEQEAPKLDDPKAQPTSAPTLVGSDDKVVYAKVAKKGGDNQPLSPHRPAPKPPKGASGSKPKASSESKSDLLKGTDRQTPGQVKLNDNIETKNLGASDSLTETRARGGPTESAHSSVQPSEVTCVQPSEVTSVQLVQDKISSKRPKTSPPPVPMEPSKQRLERHVRFPTPPQHSPASSRSSSSASSSRGAFSPHLDDFFAHGPLQEVDTGPFVEPRSALVGNSSDSSAGPTPGNVTAVPPNDTPAITQQQDVPRRSKRHVIYENLPNDILRQPQSAEIRDSANSNKQTETRPEHGQGPPPRPPRIDTNQTRNLESVRSGEYSPTERTSPYDNEQRRGIHSPGQYYPPLANLRTTPRSSPQGQSSPSQDNYPEVYSSVQPGEVSIAGTQSFFSAQSDRFATPVGWHQTQPIASRPSQSSVQTQHTVAEGWHQRQPSSSREDDSHRQEQQSAPEGWHQRQPILSREGDSHRQEQQSAPEGWHQRQPISSHEGDTHAQAQHSSQAPMAGTSKSQSSRPANTNANQREQPQGSSHQPHFRSIPKQTNTSNRSDHQAPRIYPSVAPHDRTDISDREQYRQQHPSPSTFDGRERQGINRRSEAEGIKQAQQSISRRSQPEHSVPSENQETRRTQPVYPNVSRYEAQSLSEGEKDRRQHEYTSRAIGAPGDHHENKTPELPRRRRRSIGDAFLDNWQTPPNISDGRERQETNQRSEPQGVKHVQQPHPRRSQPEYPVSSTYQETRRTQGIYPNVGRNEAPSLSEGEKDRRQRGYTSRGKDAAGDHHEDKTPELPRRRRRSTDDAFVDNQRGHPSTSKHDQSFAKLRSDLADQKTKPPMQHPVQNVDYNRDGGLGYRTHIQPTQPTQSGQEADFDYSSLPSPPHNISMGNPPVIEYALPPRRQSYQPDDPQPATISRDADQYIPRQSTEERPLTTSTPEPPTVLDPIASTSFNNSLERNRAPKNRVLSKSDLSQASDIFLENLNQKNVNVTRNSDRSDYSDYTDHMDRSDHIDRPRHSNHSDPPNQSDRSDEEKKSSSDSPVAISQFYYYDSSNGNGESSNSSFCREAGNNQRQTSHEAIFEDACCGENCPHLTPNGHDTVDVDDESPETTSFKSCRSQEDQDENMNTSESKDLNLIDAAKRANKYENLKHKLRASIRKGKNYFKRKRSPLVLDRSTKSDNDSHIRKQTPLADRKGESDFEVDYISAIELLNETSKDASLKRQLEQTVSLCRRFPEFETSPEMVEAERLLLYTTLKEKSTCKSNESVSSYRSTPKDFISGRVCVTSFEIPIKPNIHHDAYFNYFYIGVFSQGQDIRSTQSAEKADDAVFFSDCNLLYDDLNADFEINVDLYVLRLRKLSSPPTQQDNVPIKIRKSSLSDSQEEVVSRFRMHGNFVIRATDLAPFEVHSNEGCISQNGEFYLVSNNIFTLPINLYPRNINLCNEVWLTANAAYRFKNFELSGFLNVGEMNGKLNWNKRWCQIDALSLHFWNYPQECSELPSISTVDLTYCASNPIKIASREICPRAKSFQLEMRKYAGEDDKEGVVDILLFSTESQEEYSYWVKGLNYVLDFIRAWKVQVH